jgi:signal transduction histidine kinase
MRLGRKSVAGIGGLILVFCLVGVLGLPSARSILEHQFIRLPMTSVESRHDWQAFGGTWQFVDGALRNSSNERGAKLMNGSIHWKNYMVEADVLLLGEYGFAGLTIRASDEEDGVDAYHGYTAGVSNIDNALFLGRADYGWRGFAAKPLPPRVYNQQWYHMKLIAVGCVIGVSATGSGGQTATTAINDSECLSSGRFGLKSFNSGAEWRNIAVRSATRQDLVAMIGDVIPPLAVPMQSPAGADASSNDRFLDPIHRDILQYHADINAQPIGTLRLLSPNEPQPVVVHGVVTLTSPILILQDSSGAVSVPQPPKHIALEIGDEVEAKGDAELQDFSSALGHVSLRKLWSHGPVTPVAVTALQASTGALDAQFIDIMGRLSEKHVDADGTTVLSLDDGSQSFVAVASPASSSTSMRNLKLMSRLRLRGICIVDPRYTKNVSAFAVLLPSLNDVDVIEGPPWWSAGHVLALIIGILTSALASLSIYILIERGRVQAVLQERERLAYEMHDTLAQCFAGIGFQLEAIHDEIGEDSNVSPLVATAREMAKNSHEEAHRCVAALHPENLESVGLLCALKESVRRMMSSASSIKLKILSVGEPFVLPLRTSDALLRIGQEAIANAIGHGHPDTLTITLLYRRSFVELIIADNGAGFLVSSESAGFGLRGMSKRAESIGAEFFIDSQQGNGTAVHVVVPIRASLLTTYWHRILSPLIGRRRLNEFGAQ